LDPSTGAYLQTALQIAESGFVEVETGGYANAYLDFRNKVADIELSGSGIGQTSVVKAVLLNYPCATHHYPTTGLLCFSEQCSTCSGQLF
jgi:hypothetical protein